MAALLPTITVLCLVADYLGSTRLHHQLDGDLQSNMELLATAIPSIQPLQAGDASRSRIASLYAPAGFEFKLFDEDGSTIYASSPAAEALPGLEATDSRPRSVVTRPQDSRLRVARTAVVSPAGQPLGFVVGAMSLDPTEAAIQSIRRVLIAAGGIAVVISALLCYLAARPTLWPLKELSPAIRDLTRQADFSRRLPEPRFGEMRELVQSVNSLIARMELALLAQRGLVDYSSHELKRPLTVIRTDVDVLNRFELPEGERRTTLAEIGIETEVLVQIVSELATVSRREEQAPNQTELDFVTLCTSVYERYSRRDQAHIYGFAGGGNVKVLGNPLRLEQMVLNLMENAAQNTPAGGLVLMNIETRNSIVRLSVTDTGAGIPEEEQPFVFERFFRGRHARHSRADGAGLGLFVVQSIAETHGGRVGFQSKVGKGSTFVIEIPALPHPQASFLTLT